MAHRIALVVGSELHELLASVEGDDQEVFPPSPPLQQWALTELGGGRQAALLMGMAGRSHWSLSVEPGTPEPLIRFDVACRTSAVDRPALRSVYQMLRPWQWSPDAQAAVVSVDGYRCLLQPGAAPRCRLPSGSARRTRSTRGLPIRTHEFLNASLAVRIVAHILAQEMSRDPWG